MRRRGRSGGVGHSGVVPERGFPPENKNANYLELSANRRHGKTIAAYEKILSSNDRSRSWEPQQRWLEARYTLSTDYAAGGDKQKARGTLEKLLDLWKDAGPNLPLLKQAKAEYAKLQ